VTASHTRRTLLGLALTLGCGSLPYPVWDHEFAGTSHLVGNEFIYWGLVALTLAYVLIAERRPLASIGFRRPGVTDCLIGVAAAALIISVLAAIYFVVFPALHVSEDHAMNTLRAAPRWWLVASVIRAGVSEEVLFRGYPIERLQELTGSRTLAALIPLLLFALAHVGPWGWPHLLVAAVGGGLLTLLYLWRRNLWVNILCHSIVDGVATLS
jgi:uncharacterized protein